MSRDFLDRQCNIDLKMPIECMIQYIFPKLYFQVWLFFHSWFSRRRKRTGSRQTRLTREFRYGNFLSFEMYSFFPCAGFLLSIFEIATVFLLPTHKIKSKPGVYNYTIILIFLMVTGLSKNNQPLYTLAEARDRKLQ